MSILPMPPYPAGSLQQQCAATYSYLFQMAQQLNMALSALESGTAGAGTSARPAGDHSSSTTALAGQYQTLRSLIVKTADQVEKTTEQLTARMNEEYVAVSDFGTYLQELSAYLEANPEAVTQYYGFTSDLKAQTEAVDAAFRHYRLNTEGYIRTGIVAYEDAVPVYGVAVGQDLTANEVDGETVVAPNSFRAVFTAKRLSFWQDSTEVAYVSNNRLYITNITVLDGLDIGQWSISSRNGLAFRWIGGSV